MDQKLKSDGGPLTVDGPRPTSDEERWEDSHTRVTFYCPVPLLRTIERKMTTSKRSKSQVIVDALRDHLDDGGTTHA